jgi:hypothetical protein
MVDISMPGWRWEVQFMADGSTEIERYSSVSGVEDNAALLEELLTEAGVNLWSAAEPDVQVVVEYDGDGLNVVSGQYAQWPCLKA